MLASDYPMIYFTHILRSNAKIDAYEYIVKIWKLYLKLIMTINVLLLVVDIIHMKFFVKINKY